MTIGFYVTVVRGQKVGFLAGPFDDKETADQHVPIARQWAYEADPWTHFDAFGVTRIERDGALPQGVLY